MRCSGCAARIHVHTLCIVVPACHMLMTLVFAASALKHELVYPGSTCTCECTPVQNGRRHLVYAGSIYLR